MKYKIISNTISFFLGVILASLVVSMVGCLKEAPELKVPGPKTMSGRTGEASGPQATGSPCDSICRPVAWGVPLIVIKPTISSGTYKGVNYWQAKLDAKNYIPPTKYQQGVYPNFERVTIADTFPIIDTMKFWICEWVKI